VVVDIPVYTWHALATTLSPGITRPRYRSPGAADPHRQWEQGPGAAGRKRPVDSGGVGRKTVSVTGLRDEVADFCLRVTQKDDDQRGPRGRWSPPSEWLPVTTFYETYQTELRKDSRLETPSTPA